MVRTDILLGVDSMSHDRARTPLLRWITGGLAAVVATALLPSTATAAPVAPAAAEAHGESVPWQGVTRDVTVQRGAGFRAYAVPTSAAGVGNIVTAPDGHMWFVMADVNKVGRITPGGVITEYDLPPTTTGGGQVKDVTVHPDGSVWVVYDQGRKIVQARPDGTATDYVLGSFPYGEDVEIGPDNLPWVTMSFDDDGVSRVLPDGALWHDNAPPCDGALARANNGAMWCESGSRLIKINSTASGGVTYPLPANASYPYSIAAGPVGSMWFARYFSTSFTPASRGNVGWIDERTGRTTIFNTGDRTGPFDLTRGPDNAMWFANRGTGRGIGHVHPNGTGAITAVGNFSPRHLTFDKNGALWFTDPTNNVIVRVNPAQLQRTDVVVGPGSVMLAPAKLTHVGKVRAGKKPLRVRRNKLRVTISCPRSAAVACSRTAVLAHAKKARRFSKYRTYSVRPGRSKVVVLPLTKQGKRFVTRKAKRVRVILTERFGHASRTTRIRVRR